LPTILSLLNVTAAHASMGKSLTDASKGERFAFIDAEHAAGFVTRHAGRELALMFSQEQYIGYYDMTTDATWQSLIRSAPLPAETLRSLKDYIGVMGFAVAKNAIAPAPSSTFPQPLD
jgi:hypothetical protein